MTFEGMDIVSIRDLSREQIEQVLERSERMIPYARGEMGSKALDGKILATLFFEPSTRTRMSFESAMMRLGGRITDLGVPSMSSISKGESLADTIRMVEVYSDIIVIRHPREGAARLAPGSPPNRSSTPATGPASTLRRPSSTCTPSASPCP